MRLLRMVGWSPQKASKAERSRRSDRVRDFQHDCRFLTRSPLQRSAREPKLGALYRESRARPIEDGNLRAACDRSSQKVTQLKISSAASNQKARPDRHLPRENVSDKKSRGNAMPDIRHYCPRRALDMAGMGTPCVSARSGSSLPTTCGIPLNLNQSGWTPRTAIKSHTRNRGV
jgi:hypothetical protein